MRELEWLEHVNKMDQTRMVKRARRQKKREKAQIENAVRCRECLTTDESE
jgi:hypothetical protein